MYCVCSRGELLRGQATGPSEELCVLGLPNPHLFHSKLIPSNLECIPPNSASSLSTKSVPAKAFAVISTVFTMSSPGVDSVSRKDLLPYPKEASTHLLTFYYVNTVAQSHLQGRLLIPFSVSTSAVTSSTEV